MQEEHVGCLYIVCDLASGVCSRKPSGLADKEVMAATVLTSLSTSPLVLTHTQTASGKTAHTHTEVLVCSATL